MINNLGKCNRNTHNSKTNQSTHKDPIKTWQYAKNEYKEKKQKNKYIHVEEEEKKRVLYSSLVHHDEHDHHDTIKAIKWIQMLCFKPSGAAQHPPVQGRGCTEC